MVFLSNSSLLRTEGGKNNFTKLTQSQGEKIIHDLAFKTVNPE